MDHECKDENHLVLRQQPGYTCPERNCFHWSTDCGVCADDHKALHTTGALCSDCGAERLFLTRTWRWPHHGGDGITGDKCKTSGRKYRWPGKVGRHGDARR